MGDREDWKMDLVISTSNLFAVILDMYCESDHINLSERLASLRYDSAVMRGIFQGGPQLGPPDTERRKSLGQLCKLIKTVLVLIKNILVLIKTVLVLIKTSTV